MNFKKLLITFSFVMCVLSLTVHAKTMQFTMGNVDAKVDDGKIEVYKMEVAPYTVNGRTMVPVRIVAETFGADVQYIHDESKVIITMDDKKISMVIGQDVADVNGTKVKLDVPTVETNGRTLVPLRFVSETLGFDIKYLASTQQILITNDPAVIEINGTKLFLSDFKAMCKLVCENYGMDMNEEVANYTLSLMMQTVFFEAEAEKWGMSGIDPILYSSLAHDANEISGYFEDVLDASWVSVRETNHRQEFMLTFLELLYEGDKESLDLYKKENLGAYMAAMHILISDKATAEDVLKRIKKGEEFETLMFEYTEDPGVKQAPYYVFTDGEMVSEFEKAVKALKPGEISGLVKSTYGYHIIKRIEIPEEYIKVSFVDEAINEHVEKSANESTIKADNYTLSQLVELCK